MRWYEPISFQMFFKKLLVHKAFLRAFRIINSRSTLVLNLQLSILESSILQKGWAGTAPLSFSVVNRPIIFLIVVLRLTLNVKYSTTLNQYIQLWRIEKWFRLINSLLGQFTPKLVCLVNYNFIITLQEINVQYWHMIFCLCLVFTTPPSFSTKHPQGPTTKEKGKLKE